MTADRGVVDRLFRQLQTGLTDRLYTIDQPHRLAALIANRFFDCVQIGNNARLIVNRHRANHVGVGGMSGNKVKVQLPILIDRDRDNFVIDVQQFVPVLDRNRNRFVFRGTVHQQTRLGRWGFFAALLTNVAQRRKDCHLNRFGCTAGKNNLAVARSEHVPHRIASRLEHVPGFQSGDVVTTGVAVTKLHRLASRVGCDF